MFKITDDYKLELQTPETTKLFGRTKRSIEKIKNRDKISSLEVAELLLFQCNLVDFEYQQKSEVLYTFVPKRYCAYLLNVKPSSLVFLKTYDT